MITLCVGLFLMFLLFLFSLSPYEVKETRKLKENMFFNLNVLKASTFISIFLLSIFLFSFLFCSSLFLPFLVLPLSLTFFFSLFLRVIYSLILSVFLSFSLALSINQYQLCILYPFSLFFFFLFIYLLWFSFRYFLKTYFLKCLYSLSLSHFPLFCLLLTSFSFLLHSKACQKMFSLFDININEKIAYLEQRYQSDFSKVLPLGPHAFIIASLPFFKSM